MSITVRRATRDDIDAIIQLGRETYQEHFGHLWNDIDLFLDKDFSTAAVAACVDGASSSRYLLATERHELIGFAKLNLASDLPQQGLQGIELQKIYLKQSATGKQLGAMLMRAALDVANELDKRYIWLDVLKTNLRAQQFYARHGFVAIADIPFSTDQGEVGMVVMMRHLRVHDPVSAPAPHHTKV